MHESASASRADMVPRAVELRPRVEHATGKRWLVVIAALVAGCLIAELGYRARRSLQGRPYDRAQVARALAALAGQYIGQAERADGREIAESAVPGGPEGHRVVLHPYLGFDVSGDTRFLEDVQPCGARADSADRFDVLVLGGSVAQSLAETNCHVLLDALSADPRLAGLPIAVHSYARGGYKEPQQVIALAYLFARGFDCDLVILLDGFNEVALGNYNAQHESSPLFPSLRHWAYLTGTGVRDPESIDVLVELRTTQKRTERLVHLAQRLGCDRSAVLGDLTLKFLEPMHEKSVSLYQRFANDMALKADELPTLHGPEFAADTASRIDEMVVNWVESSRSIDAMCRARGIGFLHVLQPTLHDEGSKPASLEEQRTAAPWPAWVEGVREGYPRLRAEGAALREDGIAFVDCTRIFRDVTETLYFDGCHFNEKGNTLLSREIAAAVRDQVELPRVGSER